MGKEMLFLLLITVVVCSTVALCLGSLSGDQYLTVLGYVFGAITGGALTYVYTRLKR